MPIDEETTRLIDALLPNVPFDGWTSRALRQALTSLGEPAEDARLYFPGGGPEMIEAFCALADARMAQAAAAEDIAGRGLTARVRAVLAIRFAQNRGNKEAIRRALSALALPGNAARAARISAATVDAIWHAAGDKSADFSWYTKRAILAAIYSATLLYWLADTSEEDEATLRFLDRRLAGIGRLGALRRRFSRRRAPPGALQPA